MDDPIIMRGIERIVIALAAVVFCVLGYRLYTRGITTGRNTMEARSPVLRFVMTGTGPGLFFMAVGGIVLITALFRGASWETTEYPDGTKVRRGAMALPPSDYHIALHSTDARFDGKKVTDDQYTFGSLMSEIREAFPEVEQNRWPQFALVERDLLPVWLGNEKLRRFDVFASFDGIQIPTLAADNATKLNLLGINANDSFWIVNRYANSGREPTSPK